MEGFLKHVGISDITKLMSELKTNGVEQPEDLVNMDEADRSELTELLKQSGINLGDRGKVKRINVDSLSNYKSSNVETSDSSTNPTSSPKDIKLQVPEHFESDEFKHLEQTLLSLASDPVEADKLWKTVDFNGNGIVSMAEIVMFLERYFPLLNNKKAVMRAHQRTLKVDGDGDDWIQRDEFVFLLINLFYYNKILKVFEQLDTSGDGRLQFPEFSQGLHILGFDITKETAYKEFNKMDDDRGGTVLFDEFCTYVAAKQWPGGFDDYYKQIDSIGESARRKRHGNKLHGKVAGKKGVDHEPDIHTTKYDKLEMELLSVCSSKAAAKKLFRQIDADNSGKISKKEFTRWVKSKYPMLGDKDAIEYAFRKATEEGDGDKFIQPDEFKSLFFNLFYFVKLKFVFTRIDKNNDGKVSFEEFKKSLVWVGLTMDTESARQQFDSIDSDQGGDGQVDFAEFCDWVARAKIPVD